MEKKIKLQKELTPAEMSCLAGTCPAIFETNNGSYALIGKKLDSKKLGISERIGKDEILIEVPKKLIDEKGN